MHERNRILEETSNFLSVKAEDVLPAVEKLHQEILDLRGKVREKTQELIRFQLPDLLAQAPVLANGTRLLVLTLEGTAADGKSAMKLASAEPGVLAAVFTKDGDRIMYQSPSAKGRKGTAKPAAPKPMPCSEAGAGDGPRALRAAAPPERTGNRRSGNWWQKN